MKKKSAHKCYSWLLLVCFIAGQFMVALHQHTILKQNETTRSVTKTGQKPTTVQEKCYLCDVMHYNTAIINNTAFHFAVNTSQHLYKIGDHDFISISLILASGRAPPVFSVYC